MSPGGRQGASERYSTQAIAVGRHSSEQEARSFDTTDDGSLVTDGAEEGTIIAGSTNENPAHFSYSQVLVIYHVL